MSADDTSAARRGSGSNDLLGLVERLRSPWHHGDCRRAASEIERLQIQVRQADERGDEAMRRAHAAEAEVERLRVTLANESRRVCGTENDCVLQPHCSHAQKCMRPEWDAKA